LAADLENYFTYVSILSLCKGAGNERDFSASKIDVFLVM